MRQKEENFSTVGFGCGFRNLKDSSELQSLRSLLDEAIELGFWFFDTAEAYGNGISEELLGQSVTNSGRRDDLLIATKVSPENLSYSNVIAAAERSLKRLQTDYIDLYQIHWSNPAIPMRETFDALLSLVDQGKIKRIGVCNFSIPELEQIAALYGPQAISTIQTEFNLLDRSIEPTFVEHCVRFNRQIIAYSPLNQGSIPGGSEQRDSLLELASSLHVPVEALILAWLKSRGPILPITNTTKLERLKDYSVALTLKLAPEVCTKIDELFPYTPSYILPADIEVAPEGLWGPSYFRTVQEALDNVAGLSPSPVELAEQLRQGVMLKPARVIKIQDGSSEKSYTLVEGRLRYWAWRIAFGDDEPVPVLVR